MLWSLSRASISAKTRKPEKPNSSSSRMTISVTQLPTGWVYAYFEYLNGFRKVLYWSKEKMMTHADTYSKAFSRKNYEDLLAGKIPESEMWKYSSFWYKSFDDMAKKTMPSTAYFSLGCYEHRDGQSL